MISDIEFLEAVCERMQEVGLVESKSDFSTRMLGKGASYLTSMRARGRQVPEEVMRYFAKQLEDYVAADDMVLSGLFLDVMRREHQKKHHVDMLNWLNRHLYEQVPVSEDTTSTDQSRPSAIARFLSIFRIGAFGSRRATSFPVSDANGAGFNIQLLSDGEKRE